MALAGRIARARFGAGGQGPGHHFVYGICGDGTVDSDEQCDDDNNVDGDGCSWDCKLEGCGNGVLDPTTVARGGNGELINVVIAVIGNTGSDVNFRTDYWAFTRGPLRALVMLAAPLLGAWGVYQLEPGTIIEFQMMGLQLTPVRVDKLSILFGYLFHLAAFIGVVYSLHIKDPMQDVAALAGVSEATVSRVMNGKEGVSPRTKAIFTESLANPGGVDRAHGRIWRIVHTGATGEGRRCAIRTTTSSGSRNSAADPCDTGRRETGRQSHL